MFSSTEKYILLITHLKLFFCYRWKHSYVLLQNRSIVLLRSPQQGSAFPVEWQHCNPTLRWRWASWSSATMLRQGPQLNSAQVHALCFATDGSASNKYCHGSSPSDRTHSSLAANGKILCELWLCTRILSRGVTSCNTLTTFKFHLPLF